MDPVLLLHVGEDFLLPVIFDRAGNPYDMAADASRRLWLYFDTQGPEVDYGFRYKSAFARRDPSCYGDFFRSLEREGSRAQIWGRPCFVFDLLRLSTLLKDLKDLYERVIHSSYTDIPTAYVFSECIPENSRMRFMEGMEKEGFKTVGYSHLLTDCIVGYVARQDVSLQPSFGDTVLVVVSDNDRLQMTQSVFDGETWMSDGVFSIVEDFSDSPLKDGLVRYVMETIDRQNGFLVDDAKWKEEFEYQRPNADRWLALPRDREGNFHIMDFRYKGQERQFSCRVSSRQLEVEREQRLQVAIGALRKYKDEQIGESLKRIVFCGAAFDDADLVDIMVRSLGKPKDYRITSASLHRVFHSFMADYGKETEDYCNYERTMQASLEARGGIHKWISSATSIRKLRLALQDELGRLQEHFKKDEQSMKAMGQEYEDAMKASRFEDALQAITRSRIPSESMEKTIRTATEELVKVQEMEDQVFDKVKGVGRAGKVIEEIKELEKQIREQIKASKGQEDQLKAWKSERIQYKDSYEEYQRLRADFNRSRNPLERRRLHERMKNMTKEPLPALELPHVSVHVDGKVEVRGKRSFGKGEKVLSVWMDVLDGNTLPCEALLCISKHGLVEPGEDGPDCIVIKVPKKTDAFSKEIHVDQEPRLHGVSHVNIYVFPALEEIDRDAIQMVPPIVRRNL